MSFFRVTWFVGLASMIPALCAPARAADPIEFEFGGVYTQVTGSVHSVGQPFTSSLIFDPGTVDINPSPLRGSYGYIRWTAPSAGNPIVFQNEDGSTAGIRVRLDSGSSESWQVDFQGASQFFWRIAVTYPVGTFPTDALPQSLDLSQSTAKIFEADNGVQGLSLRGTITSLTVRVPEPGMMPAGCCAALLLRRAWWSHTRLTNSTGLQS